MSGFRFRLARLLRIREVEEQAARERFLSADRVARDGEERATLAREDATRGLDDLRSEQSRGSIAPPRVLHATTAVAAQDRRARVLAETARTLRMQAEAERVAWAARRRDQRGLERLEDRDRDAWRAEEARRDAQTLDEVASMRAAARDREAAANARSWERPSVPMKRAGPADAGDPS